MRVFPASGGLKSKRTLPAPMERMVAFFPPYSMRAPMAGVMSFERSCLSGTRLIFSGSLGPKAWSGGISTVAGFAGSIVWKASSRGLSIQFSPMTMSLGS